MTNDRYDGFSDAFDGVEPEVKPHVDAANGEAKGKSDTDLEILDAFIERHGDALKFNHSTKNWLQWDGHYWQVDGKEMAFSFAVELSRAMPHKVRTRVRFATAVERAARANARYATEQSEWDCDPFLVGSPGGVIDLRQCKLRPGEHGDMISKAVRVTPAEIPECPRWDAFLGFALAGDHEMIRFLQRYLGYCLTGLTREEQFLVVLGPPGTGKGTLTRTVSWLFGDYAAAAPMELFTGETVSKSEYYRADLAGKRLILASEPEAGTTWREAIINELTGSDPLSARYPAGRPFTFMPTHKLIINGNLLPDLKRVATGLVRRLLILRFDRLPDAPDTTLKGALEDEAPGILRWMMEGCLSWQKNGLAPPPAVFAAAQEYFELQDVLGRFFEERCILDQSLQITPNSLRSAFNQWAKDNDEQIMTHRAFASAIRNYTPTRLVQGKSNGARWVRGVGLKPSADPRYPDC